MTLRQEIELILHNKVPDDTLKDVGEKIIALVAAELEKVAKEVEMWRIHEDATDMNGPVVLGLYDMGRNDGIERAAALIRLHSLS